MAADTEFIKSDNFNLKLKNYLRDFFTFQYKSKDSDFYGKESFTSVRMTAGIILCYKYEIEPKDMMFVKMSDIHIVNGNKITISVNSDGSGRKTEIVVQQPLCEMVKHLYSADEKKYFMTGYDKMPDIKKTDETLNESYKRFREECAPKTDENMYYYWGRLFLETANTRIKPGSFRNDSNRIHTLLEKSAGVQWVYGEKISFTDDGSEKNKVDKYVECITADSRTLENNPFHSVYKYCSEQSAINPGAFYSFVYAVLLYFQIDKKTELVKNKPTELRINSFIRWFKKTVTDSYTNANNHRRRLPESWKDLTDRQKAKYGEIEYESFIAEHIETIKKEACGDYKEWDLVPEGDKTKRIKKAFDKSRKPGDDYRDVFVYLIENGKRLAFIDNDYVITTLKKVEKTRLYFALSPHINVGERQFANNIGELIRLGIIEKTHETDPFYKREETKKEKTAPKSVYYGISELFIDDLLNGIDIDRFSDMISFFTRTSPLGAIGSHISDRLPPRKKESIYYKHNYINNALNDYNLIDIFYAIRNKKWLYIEYRDSIGNNQYQRFVCYPVQLRENVSNGRQYLICYDPKRRSVSSLKVDFIDSIVIGERKNERFFNDDIERAEELISKTWGTDFNYEYGNVMGPIKASRLVLTVNYDPEKESFIKKRLIRETHNRVSLSDFEDGDHEGRCLKVEVEVVNPYDMLRWIRSFTRRIISVDIQYNGFADETSILYETYRFPSKQMPVSLKLDRNARIESIDERFSVVDSLHDKLFNCLYSVTFNEFGKALSDVIDKGNISEEYIKNRKKEYKDLFYYENGVRHGNEFSELIKRFVSSDSKSYFAFKNGPAAPGIKGIVPLTEIEIQWLRNILDNRFAALFLTKEEIERINSVLPEKKLFDINDMVYTGRFSDVDEEYDDPGIINNGRIVLDAIRNDRMTAMRYKTQYGKILPFPIINSPVCAEYSKRDNRFRLFSVVKKAANKKREDEEAVYTYNFERIVEVEDRNKKFAYGPAMKLVNKFKKDNECRLTVYFGDTNDIPNRVLSEFSCFKKKCIKWGNGTYKMTLTYDRTDSKEMIVRLLGFGSLITVTDDSGDVFAELRERIKSQMELSQLKEREKDTAETNETEAETIGEK